MGSRNWAQMAPTPDTMALNAAIYGYAGHSLVTPHVALKQIWWTEARIEAKVTRQFILSRLRKEEREMVDRPLAFGEGLTDDTYMEWILGRARRLFLVLAEIGVPDQIFGCIDDSWNDDDLPVDRESVASLELSYEVDETLNRKFYDTQFVYLLRELKPGSHIDYSAKELIPMEHANTIPPAVTLQTWDRVHFPERTEEIFMRRKYLLTDKDTGRSYRNQFMRDVRKAKAYAHEHIAPVWATYTSKDAGYILSNFVAEHTLGSFIQHRNPAQFARLPAPQRRLLLCEWMHCLADALASLHHLGVSHTAVRPSSVWIDSNNKIAFGDVGSLRTFQRGKRILNNEAYEYAAPELHVCKTLLSPAVSPPPVSSMGAFNKLRKMSINTEVSRPSTSSANPTPPSPTASSSSSGGSELLRSSSFSASSNSPSTMRSSVARSNSIDTITSSIKSKIDSVSSPDTIRGFVPQLPPICTSPFSPLSPTNTTNTPRPFSPLSTASTEDTYQDFSPNGLIPPPLPEAADIFSLACVYLDMLTFLLKGKLGDFVKFRRTRGSVSGNKSISVGRGRIDSSFHAAGSSRLDAWMLTLEEESRRQYAQQQKLRQKSRKENDPDEDDESVLNAVPALLYLIRAMLAWEPTQRPSAVDVRAHLQSILTEMAHVRKLCCENRIWGSGDEIPSEWQQDSTTITINTNVVNTNVTNTNPHHHDHRPISPVSPPHSPSSSSSVPAKEEDTYQHPHPHPQQRHEEEVEIWPVETNPDDNDRTPTRADVTTKRSNSESSEGAITPSKSSQRRRRMSSAGAAAAKLDSWRRALLGSA